MCGVAALTACVYLICGFLPVISRSASPSIHLLFRPINQPCVCLCESRRKKENHIQSWSLSRKYLCWFFFSFFPFSPHDDDTHIPHTHVPPVFVQIPQVVPHIDWGQVFCFFSLLLFFRANETIETWKPVASSQADFLVFFR